ncbi:MFS transporter [Ornithinimicrobium cavernae]|uniref:MFS transporter n=1 Tax=Ornithinimicrobium cavernae TaxID=2666047 RepID=UPI000D69CD94|nr:MFS transporter [Ornithinimicrobium cavernae]
MADHDESQRPHGRGLPRALTPFRHTAYRRLGAALVFSLLSGGLWVVALVWEVIRLGGGAGELSMVTTTSAIGVVVAALAGGVVADRVAQKTVLVAVEVAHVGLFGTAALLALSDLTQLWHLMVIGLLGGVVMAFYFPAYSAWLPALVPAEDLMAVNGIEGMLRPTLQQAAGPALAGALIAALSPGAAMAAATGCSVVGLLFLLGVPLTPVRRSGDERGADGPLRALLGDLAEGFRYLRRTPWFLATLLFASLMILVMMGPLEVLVPFLLKDGLGGDAGDHAMVLAGFGLGGALGSLAMASLPMPRRYLTWMILMWGLGCLPFVAMGFATGIWQVVGSAAVLGVLFSAPTVIWGTLLQRRVPSHLLGRVSSLDFFVSISLMPVSMAMAGPVSTLIGLRTTFLLAGVLPVLFAVVAILWARLPEDELSHPLGGDASAPVGV